MFVKDFFDLAPSYEKRIAKMVPKFDVFGAITFNRTYSRLMNGKQENWNDVVLRIINGTFSIRKDWYIKNHIKWDEDAAQRYAFRLATTLFDMKWMPAGRGLWAMGTSFVFERGSLALNNCAFTELGGNYRLANDLHWLMDCLMLGAGVGFHPIREKLSFHKPIGEFIHFVQDSREGWCDGLKLLLNAYLIPGRKCPVFRYDQVRPAGSPIRGFGGTCSGPGPLKELYESVHMMLINGDKIDPVRLKTDIANMVGVCVVAGNVRRSAELAQGGINDEVFMDLKDYSKYPEREEWGYMSNNSVILEHDEDFERLGEVARRVVTRGEPGVINKRNLKYGRIGRNDKVRIDNARGFNPCSPASTIFLTPKGLRKLGDLTVGDTIWSQSGWTKIIKKWSTGIKDTYRFGTTAGAFIGTDNHRIVSGGHKIEVGKATSIDSLRGEYVKTVPDQTQAIMDGLVLGDGTEKAKHVLLQIGVNDKDLFASEVASKIYNSYNKPDQYLVNTTFVTLPTTFERTIPDQYFYSDRRTVCSFLRGLYSANGSICGNRVTLKATSFDVIERVQAMLSSVGIQSYYTTNKAVTVTHANGDYVSKQSYDLNISTDRIRFQESIGFIQRYKTEALSLLCSTVKQMPRKETYDIVSIEELGREEVFDITVDNARHTYWTQGCNVSNCGEIPLEDKELCNVAETLPTMCRNHKEWLEACEFATFYTSCVSLLPTHRPETNEVLVRNRRIGVGIIDWTGWFHAEGMHKLIRYMDQGYQRVCITNQVANGQAGVPEAIRKTTIKPGGTTPKLAGKTPGIGNPTFRETLRRIRVAINHPMCPVLDKAGVPFEPCYNQPQFTRVYGYPIIQGPAAPAEEVSLWEQAMNLITVQSWWSDNAVSNTLYFKPKWKLIYSRTTVKRPGDNPETYQEKQVGQFFDEIELNLRRDKDLPLHWMPLLSPREVEEKNWKLKQKKNKWGEWEINYYVFDKNHEEGDIEKVLSMIVPHIKSCSLLPHTAKGAYRQMPEEGITKAEYDKLVANVKPIEWSEFSGSDGMDEKYCTAEGCEVPAK